MEVSDDDFRIWQQCPEVERGFLPSTADVYESSLIEWIPQTRNPGYLWLYYSGSEAQIASDEQRALASLDLRALKVPPRLTSESFRDWIRLSIQSSPFMDSVRQFGTRTDVVVWDSIAAEWGVSRSIAARWVSTAHNWLNYLDSSASHTGEADTQID